MTEIILGDAQSYLLPLDSLDLLYLSKYVQSSNDKLSPLWSQQRLNGESEYFHVKIAVQRIDEEDCYFEPLDTYTCYICDLDVPKICYKQHNESKQHEIFKKICEKVLERVAKQININNIDNYCDDNKNLYYCTPCSRAVNLKNKYQHESSDYHKKSEENLNIINDFYKKVIENGTRINLPSEHSLHDSDSDSDESEIQDIQSDIVNKHLEHIIPNIGNGLQKDFDSDDEFSSISDKNNEIFAKIQDLQTASQLETTELCNRNTSEQHQPFHSYLKEMISRYKLDVATPVTDGEYIIIVSPNGDKVKVSREHFHSYKHINKHVYCQVCKMWISQNTSPHELTEFHVRNIFKRVNENYARMMNTVYCHCLICNEVILTESDHQNISDDHKNLLVDAKTQQNTENVVPKTLCDICNMYIDTQDLKSHNNSKEHNNKTETNTDMLQINNIVKINYSKYFCNSCKTNLDSNALNDHISDRTHIDKMSVTSIVTKAEYCETCKVEIPQGGMKAHNASESHKDGIIKIFWGGIKNGFTAFIKELKNELQKNDTPRKKTEPKIIQCSQNKISAANTAQIESLTSQIKTPLPNTAQNKSLISVTKLSLTDTAQNESLTSQNKTTLTNTTPNNNTALANTIQNENLTSVNKPSVTKTQNESFTPQNQSAQTNTAHDKSLNSQNKTTQPNTGQNESLVSKYKPSLANTAQNKTALINTAQNIGLASNISSTSTTNNNISTNKTNYNKRQIILYGDITLLIYTDDTKRNVKCELCNVRIPNNENNLIEHLLGYYHCQLFEKYTKFLEWSDQTKIAVKCRICDVCMPNLQRNVYEHMKGNHMKQN